MNLNERITNIASDFPLIEVHPNFSVITIGIWRELEIKQFICDVLEEVKLERVNNSPFNANVQLDEIEAKIKELGL